MSKRKPTRDPESYEVGYRKPPPEHQFRVGRSGNPKGRPRDKRPLEERLRIIAERAVKVTDKATGKQVRMPRVELLWHTLLQDGAKGNAAATKFVFSILLRQTASQGEAVDLDVLNAEDRAILDAYLRSRTPEDDSGPKGEGGAVV
jgi:hypothetical protein